VIDQTRLFNDEDPDGQAVEMRKILLLAGIDTQVDLKNAEVMDAIQEVLTSFNFDPEAPVDEEELIFTAKIMRQDEKFSAKKRKTEHAKRTGIVKKVDPTVEARLL